MGYVPPTFEEFCNPVLLEARLRRQEHRNFLMYRTAGIIAVVFGLILTVAR